jgi:hypothetical protein
MIVVVPSSMRGRSNGLLIAPRKGFPTALDVVKDRIVAYPKFPLNDMIII